MNYPAFLLTLPLLLGPALAACGGDDSGGGASTGGAGGGTGGTGVGGSGGASGGAGGSGGGVGGSGGSGGVSCPPYTARSGTGSATYTPIGGNAQTVSALPEVACRTLRKKDGAVGGYLASFGKFQPNTTVRLDDLRDQIDRFEIKYVGAYTGDGALPGVPAYLIQRADGSNASSAGGTLTLSNSGKTGKLVDGTTSIEFTCAADDDVTPTAGTAATDAAGRAIFEDKDGIVAVFDAIHCSLDSGQLELGFPFTVGDGPGGSCLPSEFYVSTLTSVNASGPGSYDLEPGSWIVSDLTEHGRVNIGGTAIVTLTAVTPPTGTLSASGGTNLPFTASFTCPTGT